MSCACQKKKAFYAVFIFVVAAVFIFNAGFSFENQDYIKWVDCKVPYAILKRACEYDVSMHGSQYEFDFVKALAYLAVKNGNKFNLRRDIKNLDNLVYHVKSGKKIDDFFSENKYYKYYVEAYNAIFAEFIGEYKTASGDVKYGCKNYHPFARGYWFSHYDDFGASRSFGFKRKHLGHDIMGSIGTPIVAIEGGTVTELGWNKYGGWRIGIRSFDKKRSYYYAHLRKNKPYIEGLKKGDTIVAGQVIGYLGVTGYSSKENANMKTKPHLHLGMQLIFDESQYQGPKEIWIDMYQITKFLSEYRVAVTKDEKDFRSINLKRSL